MSHVFGVYGPTHPWLKTLGHYLTVPLLKVLSASRKFYTYDSKYARERAALMKQKVRSGETVYLLGIGPATHNTGVALVETSKERGVLLLCNNEEERYTGIK